MKILFTTNNKFWSKVFRYLTDEPISHVLLKFDIDGFELCIDCSTEGGRLMTWDKSKKNNTPIKSITIYKNYEIEKRLFALSSRLVGAKYDFGAYKYGLWRAFMRKFIGVQAPKYNKWSDKDKFACTEIFIPIMSVLDKEFGISFKNKDLAIMSPLDIYLHIQGQLHHVETNNERTLS